MRGRTGSWWRRLAPDFEEQLPLEVYRAFGKVRFFVAMILGTLDVIVGLAPQLGGVDPRWYWRVFGPVCAVIAASAACGLWIWRRPPSLPTIVRLNRLCAVTEVLTNVAVCWLFDTIHTHLIGITTVFVLGYRFFFDFETGLTALVTAIASMWLVVLLEIARVVPIAPGLIDGIPRSSAMANMRLGAMEFVTVGFVLGFLIANLAVARLSQKDRALRLLRENLAAVDPGRVGLHTGRVLRDRYELRRVLGAGGMGEVYEARHTRTNRRVAVKLLHRHLAQSGELLARFRREAEVTGRLGSAHVVEILDVDDDDGQPFLVLEYLEGESLGARMQRLGTLPLAEVAELVAQIAEGLDKAHAAGVVHRDLKPDNVFLTTGAGGVVAKILDFGISKVQGDATAITREIGLLGTPDFMSPEQASGLGDVGAASDLWALGAIVYNALTGSRPFPTATIPTTLRAIVEDEPVSLLDRNRALPREVADVVAIAMAKRPEERFSTALELAHALASASQGAPSPELRDRAKRLHRGNAKSIGDEAKLRREIAEAKTFVAE